MDLFGSSESEDTGPQLGQRAKDRISGFEGIVTDIAHHISGCERYCIHPADRDNIADRGDGEWFYGEQLEVVDEATEFSGSADRAVKVTTFDLGDRVRDDITGFEGVATTITFDMFNCPQAALQPTDFSDISELPGREWFDAPRLIHVDSGVSSDYETLASNPVEQQTGPSGADKGQRRNKP